MTSRADLEDRLFAVLYPELAARGAPDFWEYLSHVKIETDDPKNPMRIPLDPWPLQRDQLARWLAGESQVWLKRRQVGASWCLAAYAWWMAAYHPGWHVALFSAGQRETNELIRKVQFVADNLPVSLQCAYVGTETMKIAGGSQIIGFPSTENAGISFTFRLIVADEAAFHPYGRQNYAAYRPSIDAGGQYLCASTADPRLGPSGFFYDMYQDAKKGENDYVPVFTGRWARPGQDETWWKTVERRYKGNEEARDAFYPVVDSAAFVARSGLVLPMFIEERHVTKPQPEASRLTPWLREGHPIAWEDCLYRAAGVDPGGGDPTAIVPVGIYKGRQGGLNFHQYAEFYRRGAVSIDEIAGYLSQWHNRAPLWTVEVDAPDDGPIVSQLQTMGLPARGAIKDKGERNKNHAWLLETNRLTLHSSCTNCIAEYYNYRWIDKVDPTSRDRYATGTPHDHHADGKDALGYVIMRALRAILEPQEPEKVRVRW
jgi:hypothetical protein